LKLFRTKTPHPQFAIRAYPTVKGELFSTIGNWSECMMHLRMSDKELHIELRRIGTGSPYCQIWKDGREFSGPITVGEGGFYDASHMYGFDVNTYYIYVDESRLTAEQIASIVPCEEEKAWLISTTRTTSLDVLAPIH
jgi:hypothetical protein